jgi:hypothetical protein
MKAIWLVLCVAVALSVAPEAPAVAAPGVPAFDNLLPDSTVIYLSVRDLPELLAKIKETAGYKIFTQLKLLERLAPPDKAAKVQEVYGTFIKPLGNIFSGEVTLAITSLDNLEHNPEIVLLADVGQGELALEELIKGTIYPLLEKQGIVPEQLKHGAVPYTKIVPNPTSPEDTVLFAVNNGVLMVALRDDTMGKLIDAAGAGVAGAKLPANAGYADVRRAQSNADLTFYVNVAAFMARALEEDDDEAAAWLKVFGIDTLRAVGVGVTIGADGSGSSTLRLSTDGPPGGWLGVFARASAPFKSIKRVPAEAGLYYAVNLGSLEELYKEIVKTVEVVGEQGVGDEPEEFAAGIEQIETLLGMKLEDEILPAFGGEIALAAKVPEAMGIPPAVLLIEVKDKATVERLVARVFELIESFGGDAVKLTKTTHDGVEITTALVAPVIAPGVAVLDDYLVVGTSAEAVRSVIDTKSAPSLETREDFRATMSPLPTSGTVMVYIDLKAVYEFVFPLVAATAPREAPIGEMIGDLATLGEHLSGFGAVVSGDASGLTYKTYSKNALFEPLLAFGAGVALPALMSARQQAEMVTSMSNARQLHLAIQVYAADHDDTLPAKLSDLVPDYVSSPRAFVHPKNQDKANLIDLDKPETVDEYSDYELVLKGVKLSDIDDPSETVLLQEKKPFLKNARVVVFADGHCEEVPEGASVIVDVGPDDGDE